MGEGCGRGHAAYARSPSATPASAGSPLELLELDVEPLLPDVEPLEPLEPLEDVVDPVPPLLDVVAVPLEDDASPELELAASASAGTYDVSMSSKLAQPAIPTNSTTETRAIIADQHTRAFAQIAVAQPKGS